MSDLRFEFVQRLKHRAHIVHAVVLEREHDESLVKVWFSSECRLALWPGSLQDSRRRYGGDDILVVGGQQLAFAKNRRAFSAFFQLTYGFIGLIRVAYPIPKLAKVISHRLRRSQQRGVEPVMHISGDDRVDVKAKDDQKTAKYQQVPQRQPYANAAKHRRSRKPRTSAYNPRSVGCGSTAAQSCDQSSGGDALYRRR